MMAGKSKQGVYRTYLRFKRFYSKDQRKICRQCKRLRCMKLEAARVDRQSRQEELQKTGPDLD